MKTNANLQQIIQQFLPAYQQQHAMSWQQDHVCHQISQCRTAALGGQVIECSHCDFKQIRYHSCRNRHCPQCQQQATKQWVARQTAQLLPTPYFHLVFTLPHELNALIKQHDKVLYDALFQSAWRTIKQLGADKKRLNGEMGMTAVLHTWGQNLNQHVHLHCLMPGGALSKDQRQWQTVNGDYLFPVRAASRLFRGKMVSLLRALIIEQQWLTRQQAQQLLDKLMAKDWIVYAKSTLQHTKSVIAYLARYTHKAAISNQRICQVNDQQVHFTWKDYRDGQQKICQLSGEEFLRRYLLHVLPKRYMRIRHYGFLANRCRQQKLHCIHTAITRQALAEAAPLPPTPCLPPETRQPDVIVTPTSCPCPKCKKGQLLVRGFVSLVKRATTKLIVH